MDKPDKTAAPDHTAVRTALWRGLHLQIDSAPYVFEDNLGLLMVAPPEGWQVRPDMKFTRRLRASIVARARFIEDLIVEQSRQGLGQYVLLGAGLDTFGNASPRLLPGFRFLKLIRPRR